MATGASLAVVARSRTCTFPRVRLGCRQGLDRDDLVFAAASECPAEPREREPGEVGATAGTGDDDVRLLTGHLHLEDRFLADHSLVEHDVIQPTEPSE